MNAIANKRSHNKAGFTIAELLISLVIFAILLTAVATAMYASLQSYKQNQQIAAAFQTARATLDRMKREIRTADAVNTTGSYIAIIPPLDPNGLQKIEYSFQNGTLNYIRTVNGTPTTYPLIAATDDVSLNSFAVTNVTVTDSNGDSFLTDVTARLVLKAGTQTFGVTASASPRRNQTN